MNEQEQRIAIAEAVGCINVKMWGDLCIASLGIDNNGYCWGSYVVKDYLNDLNAMHEAEKILFPKHEAKWAEFMSMVCGHSWRIIYTATAGQRAEAFLRTIGKWTTNETSAGTDASGKTL